MAWNGSGSNASSAQPAPKPTAAKKSPTVVKGIVAGCVVVVLAVAAYFLLFFKGAEKLKAESDAKKPSRIKEVKPTLPVASPMAETAVVAKVVKPPKVPVGNVITARSSRAGQVMTLMDGTVITNVPRVIFKRDFERTLMVALRPMGLARPLIDQLLRKYDDAQILSMLKEMTVPDEGDEDDVKRCKNEVQKLKEQILLEVADGRPVREVLEQVKQEGVHANALHAETMRMRAEAIRSEDPVAVRQTVQAVNELRAKKGLPALSVPKHFEDPEAPVQKDDGAVGRDVDAMTFEPTETTKNEENNDE